MYKITCHTMGGLGNQLFQISTTLSAAWEQNKEAIFEKKDPEGYIHANRPSYWDTVFNKIKTVGKLEGIFSRYDEQWDHRYNKIPDLPSNLLIKGYFQTSKYFDKYAERLLQLFTIPENDMDTVNNYIDKLRLDNPKKQLIGLHVRRTDYIKLGWDLKLDYFLRAMDYFNTILDNPIFVCFTDDPIWCKQNIPNIIICENQKDYIDMFIYSKLDSYIMSNSSFSWWGVYMGNIG